MLKVWVVEILEEELENWSETEIKLYTTEDKALMEYGRIRAEKLNKVASNFELTVEEIEDIEFDNDDIEIEEFERYFEIITYDVNKYAVSVYEQKVEE